MRHATALTAVLLAVSAVAARQPSSSLPSTASEWNTPFEPFHLAGPIHYVGTADLAAFLIVTPQGHILVDGALPEGAPLIQQSIRALGFKVEDVKVLLTTQAHYDHVGSLAAMQQASGGQVMAMEGDAELIAAGGRGDYLFGDRYPFPAVKVDRVLKHGDTVSLGGITLRALHTPGHTKGSTTWQTAIVDDGRPLTVIFPASTSVNPGTVLPSMPTYPNVGADYERTFRMQFELRPDIWLGGHGSFFGLKDKRARQKAGEVNPFVDPAGWKASLERRWAAHKALKPGTQQ
jgi:metallo-beta-lactamase class B